MVASDGWRAAGGEHLHGQPHVALHAVEAEDAGVRALPVLPGAAPRGGHLVGCGLWA
jgi:hypothetical protein